MKQSVFEIRKNEKIAKNTYRLELFGDCSAITKPGQFVNLSLPSKFLRRPISVCDVGESSSLLTLIYKTVGSGTELLSEMEEGSTLDVLSGLGNGYNTALSGDRPLLIGGGVGIPPLYYLCKVLLKEGKHPSVLLGFNQKEELFLQKEFEELGVPVFVTSADGSVGIKGFVTDALQKIAYSYFYACGPLPMFKALDKKVLTEGQYSLEERMGCGFGACMGCSIQTKNGSKRVCKDGPVFERKELLF